MHLVIFDTTLRDGEQSPGVTLTLTEKVQIATQLSKLGVDVCEAGFPVASNGDYDAVEAIAKEVGHLVVPGRREGRPMTICALARCTNSDIKLAWSAIHKAAYPRIHTFLATSDIHLEHKLKISRAQCIQKAVAAITYACELGCKDIEFSCEDAGRTSPEFLLEVLNAVVKAGATTLNIPDTVGYTTPGEYEHLIRYLVTNVQKGDPEKSVVFSTHCHNDLGLATANTLAGILGGAMQVEVTINGIGERAGNTALEEIVMAIHTHPNLYPVTHNIDTYLIHPTSQLVTKKTGMPIQPNKAIVGANAFAHESGIHQDGMLKNKTTYEIIDPSILGLPAKSLVLGKHSGRNAFKNRMEEITIGTIYENKLNTNKEVLEKLFVSFKSLADSRKSGVTDHDLFLLLDSLFCLGAVESVFEVVSVSVMSATDIVSTATVTLRDYRNSPTASNEEEEVKKEVKIYKELTDAATGLGPIHAIFNAVNRLIGITNVLSSYSVKSVAAGSDSLGNVEVRISESKDGEKLDFRPKIHDDDAGCGDNHHDVTYFGSSIGEDILVASAHAYINAVNRMFGAKLRNISGNGGSDGVRSRNVNV